MPEYIVKILEMKNDSATPVVTGHFKTFKELELALERGLKCSVIPKKKAPAKKKAKK